MKVLTILGARPQFIKAAAVSRVIRKEVTELIVHTGQHYDANMSDIFFEELNIPKPDYHLGIGSGNHGKQTGEMLAKIEEIILTETPDFVLVYGDTNSTLAGALAAAKLHVPIVHIEAGLRSFNKKMPEEVNRILTDHISTLLLCPTDTAIQNLTNEHVSEGVYNVGDVMYDAVLYNKELAASSTTILERENLTAKDYLLITIHRRVDSVDLERMKSRLADLGKLPDKKVWPIHPRTKHTIRCITFSTRFRALLNVIEPVGYLDMLSLETNAKKIVTDSGGVQKEAYFAEVPCVTVRDQTEWVETLIEDANILTGTDTAKIVAAVNKQVSPSYTPVFGDGKTADKVLTLLKEYLA